MSVFTWLAKNIAYDKLLHFACSAIIAVIVKWVLTIWCDALHASLWAFVFTLCVGLGKEVYDLCKGGYIDVEDLLADLVGAIVGVV